MRRGVLSSRDLRQSQDSAIRFAREMFSGLPDSHICYGLPVCSPPCTDLTGFPANGDFYIQAFNEIGPLLDMTTTVTGLLCWRDFHPQE
jgi:hypothetical protein